LFLSYNCWTRNATKSIEGSRLGF